MKNLETWVSNKFDYYLEPINSFIVFISDFGWYDKSVFQNTYMEKKLFSKLPISWEFQRRGTVDEMTW